MTNNWTQGSVLDDSTGTVIFALTVGDRQMFFKHFFLGEVAACNQYQEKFAQLQNVGDVSTSDQVIPLTQF